MSLTQEDIKKLHRQLQENQKRARDNTPKRQPDEMAPPNTMWASYPTAVTSTSPYAERIHAPSNNSDRPFLCKNTVQGDTREVTKRRTTREWCKECRTIHYERLDD